MPTIEIVCIGQINPISFSDAPFAVEAENKLVSHRALFQSDFDKLQGCIYHLGNSDLRKREGYAFFAYELINKSLSDGDEKDCLKFNDEYIPHVKNLLNRLLVAASIGQVIFSSDWQFSSEETRKFGMSSEKEFWKMHDANQLRFNALYEITA